MTIKFSLNPDGQILEIVTSGVSDDMAEAVEYAEALITAAKENNCTHLLCDESRLRITLGTVETFNHAEYCARFASVVHKAAFIPHPMNVEIAEFWTTAICNRGAIAKVFTSIEEARDWIQEGTD